MTNVLALPAGTELVGDFRIGRVLGAGGFGMTYLAEEIALGRQVTIKEYFPTDFAARGEDKLTAIARDEESAADFEWGLERFISEAQTLARFDHPNIVRVFRYFQANGTAYLVLTFEEGLSLKSWLRGLGRAPRQRELDDILAPLLEALETVHAADYLHRDIAPDNIIIRKDGSPVLIDFGSARGEIAARSRTVSALVKPGYSPYEQYAESGARQGPWTDIYALGATLYHAICGKRPPDAPSRVVRDELAPTGNVALAAYRQRFLMAVDRALALDPGSRPQSVAAWRGDLLAPEPARPGWFQRATGRGTADSDAAKVAHPVAAQAGAAPPLPDAPGAPGQMLDFIDGLKEKAGHAASLAAPAAILSEPPPVAACDPEPTVAAPQPSKPSGPSRKATRDKLPVAVKERTRPPRPKPVRFGDARQWRAFGLKFVIGAGIAGAAIHYKDRMPTWLGAAESGRSANSANLSRSDASVAGQTGLDAHRLTMLSGHRGGATAVGFTADGRAIVTAGSDGTLKVWNAASGANQRTIQLAEGEPTAMAVQGRRALTGHADGRVALWDVDTGERLASFRRSDAGITAVGFMRNGQRLIVSSADAALTMWDTMAPQSPVTVVEAHDGIVTAVAADRGSFIATGGDDNTIRLWRADDLKPVRTYRGHKDTVSALAISPDGRYLAAAAVDGRIRVWSTSSTSLYRLNSAHRSRIRGLAFSPAGDIIASAADDGSVQLWQVRQSKVMRAQADGGSPARALAFSPDGSRAAVASADGSVRFWDAAPATRNGR